MLTLESEEFQSPNYINQQSIGISEADDVTGFENTEFYNTDEYINIYEDPFYQSNFDKEKYESVDELNKIISDLEMKNSRRGKTSLYNIEE